MVHDNGKVQSFQSTSKLMLNEPKLLTNQSISARKKLIETFQYEDFSIANCIFPIVLVLQGADIFKKCTASWKLPRHGSSNLRKKDQEAPLSTN